MGNPHFAVRNDGGFRLADSSSLYLRQHAGNPVAWWPWGAAAIAEARRLDRPIFLSIGYSTCHWCHVMARESFEDAEIAALLEASYLSIKVDREAQPEVDEIYMTACQVFTRITEGRPSGGWPLSVFLEPRSLRPFFVGTYFPPQPAHGRASFRQVLEALAAAWRERPGEVIAQSSQLGDLVAESLAVRPEATTVEAAILDRAADALEAIEDREHGGFGGGPKFPQPVQLRLLEAAARRRPALATSIDRALDAMGRGGIFDHVAGGFHRYAVDASWTVPHFEKMLYDQGQLLTALAESVRRSGDPFRRRTMSRTAEWLLRSMRVPGGAFAAAFDADTGDREGATFLWTPESAAFALREHGAAELVSWALAEYGLDGPANFRDPHHPEDPPAWVLRLAAKPREPESDAVHARRDAVESALAAARDSRPQPQRDDAVIAGWNGLAIGGLAAAATAMGDAGRPWLEAAAVAARSVLASHWHPSAREPIFERLAGGGPAPLEDHALFAEGLLALAGALATFGDAAEGAKFADAAAAIAEVAERRFGDSGGGWFDSEAERSDLFVRVRRIDDGAVPSGAGTMARVALALHRRDGDDRWLDRAAAAISATSAVIVSNPIGAALSTLAVAELAAIDPSRLPRSAAVDSTPPVRARLEPAVPRFSAAGDAQATLQIEIDPPHHIHAHDPGEEGLVGLAVRGDGAGLEVEPEYPRGDLYRERLRVHARSVSVPIRLRRRAPGGRVLVQVQPCTDRHCLPPLHLEVEIP